MKQHRPFFFIGLGLTLSSMFFYPLTASLNDSLFYMHWQTVHTYELFLSWLGVALLFAGLLWILFNIQKTWQKLLVIGIISILPFSSMGSPHRAFYKKLNSAISHRKHRKDCAETYMKCAALKTLKIDPPEADKRAIYGWKLAKVIPTVRSNSLSGTI